MYRHKTKKYRAAAVGAVLAAVLMLGFAGCDKLPTSSDSAATAAPTPTPEPEDLTVFAEGTTMDGIDISGMKLAEAEKVCRAAALKAVCEHQRHGEKRRYRNDRKGQRADRCGYAGYYADASFEIEKSGRLRNDVLPDAQEF